MVRSNVLTAIAAFCHVAHAGCPYMDGAPVARRDGSSPMSTDKFLEQYEVDDSKAYLTSPVGGPIPDQNTLKAGERGPSLLEDQIFRRKIMSFGMNTLDSPNTRRLADHYIQIMSVFPNAPSMPVVREVMENSSLLETGPTSPAPPSWPRLTRKPRSSFASQLLLEVAAPRTLPETFMALPSGSIPTKATSVCTMTDGQLSVKLILFRYCRQQRSCFLYSGCHQVPRPYPCR